jgi:hypothetical protein
MLSGRVLSLEEPEALLFLERLDLVYSPKVKPMIFHHVDLKPNVAGLINSSHSPQRGGCGLLHRLDVVVIVWAYHPLVQWLRGEIPVSDSGACRLKSYVRGARHRQYGLTTFGHIFVF